MRVSEGVEGAGVRTARTEEGAGSRAVHAACGRRERPGRDSFSPGASGRGTDTSV